MFCVLTANEQCEKDSSECSTEGKSSCGCSINRDKGKYSEDSQGAGPSEDPGVDYEDQFVRTNGMVYIPGGTFTMGSDDPIFVADGEGPARRTTVDSFYLDKYEVSNAEFQRFVKNKHYKTEVS